MKSAAFASLLLAACTHVHAKVWSNPLGSVLTLLDELASKTTKDAEAEAKAYAEYVEFCDDQSRQGDFAIRTASATKAKLEAKIAQLGAAMDAASGKVEDLAAAIGAAGADLQDATLVREKEKTDFLAAEKELLEALDVLTRAITILDREMAKNPAAFAQMSITSSAATTLRAFGALLEAAAFSSADQKTLVALVQSRGSDTDDDDELSAPDAAAYKTHSGNLLNVLEDLKDKAEGQLSDLRKAEANAKHNFQMLKQSLDDEAAVDTKEMEGQKSSRAAAEESRATAQGDLGVAARDLDNSKAQQAIAHATCSQIAEDHEATVAARKEELKVIAQAKQILIDTTTGAGTQTYSFLQVDASASTSVKLQTQADLAGREVIELVRRLAKQEHSPALTQLVSRISAAVRYGATSGQDVFAEVKSLIEGMLAKLEREAGADATEKAYCDEQIAKTEIKKGELEFDIEKMTSKIDQAAAKSVQVEAEIKALQAELAGLARSQAQLDMMRADSRAEYKQAKADLESGLSGVRQAIGLLRDYYSGSEAAAMLQDSVKVGVLMQQPASPGQHSKAMGTGGSIIDLLEVIQSDFAQNLAKVETEEADAQNEYEKMSRVNALTKTMKEQDVKYSSQESKSLGTTVAEYSADRETSSAELNAVLDYYAKIKERCIAKPETYAERARRRAAEIQGLKQALSILEDETALVQRKRRGSFRGAMVA